MTKPGLFNIFEKKSSPPSGADASKVCQPGVEASASPSAMVSAEPVQSTAVSAAAKPMPVTPAEEKPLFALFKKKSSSCVENDNISGILDPNPNCDLSQEGTDEVVHVISAINVVATADRRNPRRSASAAPNAALTSTPKGLMATPAAIFLSADKRREEEKKSVQGMSQRPPIRRSHQEVVDVEHVASIFHTEKMKEAIRQKEKDDFLKAEMKKSRETEMSFFKSEKSTGKSLNALLMRSSSASAAGRVTGSEDGLDDAHRGPKINFADVVNFPKWQHVAVETPAVPERINPNEFFMAVSPLGCDVPVKVSLQCRPNRHGTSPLTTSESYNRSVVDLCLSPELFVSASQPGGVERRTQTPCDPRDPFSLDSFSLRSLWLQYMLSKKPRMTSSSCVVDISCEEDGDNAANEHASKTGANLINLVDAFSPKSSKDICGNKREVRSFKKWLHEWIKIHEARKQKQVARELKRVHDEEKNANIGGKMKKGRPPKSTTSSKGLFGNAASKKPITKFAAVDNDDEASWNEEDSASVFSMSDDELSSNNMAKVFIVQGPTGCGKTSLVVACAQELGFDIKEENTINCRAGALVKKRVFETSQSKGMATLGTGGGQLHLFGAGGDESIPRNWSAAQSLGCEYSHGMKLILFDEADLCFDDDAGMYRAIVELAKDSKCPIVITTQTDLFIGEGKNVFAGMKPLPDVAKLALPSLNEVTAHISEITRKLDNVGALCVKFDSAAALEADVCALAAFCGGDIRACLATLQVLVDKVPHNLNLWSPVGAESLMKDPQVASSAFNEWLFNSRRDEYVLRDAFSDAFGYTSRSTDPSGGSGLSVIAPSVSPHDAKFPLRSCQYCAPVVISVLPHHINPYQPSALHIEGRNFLQKKLSFSSTSIDEGAVQIAPVYVWLCGERFEARICSDELAVVDLPAFLMESGGYENEGQLTPRDWYYFGTQSLTVQVGGGAARGSAVPVVGSDMLCVSREFYRYLAADSPECVPFMSCVSCDTYCYSRDAFIVVIDPYDVRSQLKAGTRFPHHGKKQKCSPSCDKIPLQTKSTPVGYVSVSSSTTINPQSASPEDPEDFSDSPAHVVEFAGVATLSKKRTRKNIISDEDEESGVVEQLCEENKQPESVHAESENTLVGSLFDDEVVDKTKTVLTVSDQRKLVCSVIDECLQDPECAPFAEPVSVQLYPQYYEIVKRPIDLGTIKETLLEGAYDIPDPNRPSSGLKKLRRQSNGDCVDNVLPEGARIIVDFSSFVQDVRLVWKNCLDFNDPESEITAMAEKMSILFESILQREGKQLLDVFSWVYRVPPDKKGRKKRSVRRMNESAVCKGTIASCFQRSSMNRKIEFIDSDEENAEWLEQYPQSSVQLSNGLAELPKIQFPSHLELCASLAAANADRSARIEKLNIALGSTKCTYNMHDGITDKVSQYSKETESWHCSDPCHSLFSLARLSASRSDADLLLSAFSFQGMLANPFAAPVYGFVDGASLSPVTTDILDGDENVLKAVDAAGSLSGFISGAGTVYNSKFVVKNDGSFGGTESLWSDPSFQRVHTSRLCYPLKSSNSIYKFATPFSGIAWRGGWSSLNSNAVALYDLSIRMYTKNEEMSRLINHARNSGQDKTVFGNCTILRTFMCQKNFLSMILSNDNIWGALSNSPICSSISNGTAQWSMKREFVLVGLPFFRAMLRAESELAEDGKTYVDVSRYSPDGEDMSNLVGLVESTVRSSSRLSLSRRQLRKFQHFQKYLGEQIEGQVAEIIRTGYVPYYSEL